jgi:hypothetical protein
MDIKQLLDARDVAGARYTAAVAELHDSLIEIGGIDEALENRMIDGRNDFRTFFNLPQNLGTLAHPVYAPLDAVTCWRDEIKARRDEILATFNR